jgi:hypothetical protein
MTFRLPRLPALLGAAAVLAAILVVFHKPFFGGQTLFSPDGAPFFTRDYPDAMHRAFYGFWENQIAGNGRGAIPSLPNRWLAAVLPPMAYHLSSYLLSILLSGFAAVFYLRGRGARDPLVLAAAFLAMAFSGYTFTLISAGHRGNFDMTPWAILLFGCMDRAIQRGHWVWYAAAGACVAHGLAAQPDVMTLFLLAAAAYALWLLATTLREGPRTPKTFLRLGGGGALAVAVVVLLSLNTFSHVFLRVLPSRQSAQGQTPQEKWVFATNWSLPPEEVLEFFIPGVYGRETGDVASPYWGRVGQSLDWEKTKQGFPNYKQHTVYLGLIPLLFAFYALARGALRRRADVAPPGLLRFWAAVWLIALALALGRYAPFYRAFYSLPYMGSIRAPIKFVHLMELATVLLFGLGLAQFLRDLKERPTEAWRLVRNLSASLAGILLLATLIFASGRGLTWERMGLAGQAKVLQAQHQRAILHALFLLAGVAVTARLAATKAGFRPFAAGVILPLLLFDVLMVCTPYVRVRDVSYIYQKNEVAAVLADQHPPARIAWRLGPMNWYQPAYATFAHHALNFLEPGNPAQIDDLYKDFFDASGQRGYLRLLQLTATDHVIAGAAEARNLDALPVFSIADSFAFQAGGGLLRVAPERAQAHVLKHTAALPRALVQHRWRERDEAETLRTLFDPAWDPMSEALVPPGIGSQTNGPPAQSAVTIEKYLRNEVDLRTRLDRPGILMLQDKWDPNWTVRVNGQPATAFRVNHLMRGLKLESGEHHISMRYAPYLWPFRANLAGTFLVWSAVLVHACRRKPKASP